MSKVTKNWTTVFAQITGRDGEIIGIASRGVEPLISRTFVASLALDSDTAISMIHRDGTIIARYPKDDKLVGYNAPAPLRSARAGGRQHFRTLHLEARLPEDKVGAVKSLTHFPILIVATTRPRLRWPTGGRRPAAVFAAAWRSSWSSAWSFLIVRQLRRQHAAAQHKLSEKSQHLDTAINNMTQGLLLFDLRPRDLQPRYIDMFGLSPESSNPALICAT